MTVHTIPADHLDAARSGVLVVDGEREAGCVEACPPGEHVGRYAVLIEPEES